MERGETTAQAVLAVPVLLLVLLLGVQISMFFNTAQLASIAAQDGAIAGSVHGGSETLAIAAAIKTTAEQRVSEAKTPDVQIDNGVIEVKVILHVPSVVPFFTPSVSRSASEPLERFVLEVDR